MARSFTVTQSIDNRDFSVSQEGFSRAFHVETGIGPVGPPGPGGGELTSYVDQIAALPDYHETFPNSDVTAATSSPTPSTIAKRDENGAIAFGEITVQTTGGTFNTGDDGDGYIQLSIGTNFHFSGATGIATLNAVSTASLTLQAGASVTCADAAAALSLRNAAGLGTTNTAALAAVITPDVDIGVTIFGIGIRSTGRLAWTNTANPYNDFDTGISRTATKTLAIGDGTAGNATGTLELANVVASGKSGFGVAPIDGFGLACTAAYFTGDIYAGSGFVMSDSTPGFNLNGSKSLRVYNGGSTTDIAVPTFVVQAKASQISNLQEWHTSAGSAVVSISASGNLNASGTIKPGAFTVATTPTGVTGAQILVTDAEAPAIGSAVASGAGTDHLVACRYNGSAWIVTEILT